uniref:Putative secreted peptide n=1 Tax=Anopheles braziliensis TaxID=58242 RepID=A0A2M3ZSV4_9DIPT
MNYFFTSNHCTISVYLLSCASALGLSTGTRVTVTEISRSSRTHRYNNGNGVNYTTAHSRDGLMLQNF